MDFYDGIADFYDDMTRNAERIGKEKPIFQNILNSFPFHTALDIACGTGLHTIVLHELGVRITGMDPSMEMLRLATEHARALGYDIPYLSGSMQEPAAGLDPCDALFCLGNSIPHILNRNELEKTLANFSRLLNKNGLLVIQLLNYDRILQEQNRIVNISNRDENEYIRFYDFLDEFLQFNILVINRKEDKVSHRLNSVLLKPWLKNDFLPLLAAYSFTNIELWGNLAMQPFAEASSTDLVIKAIKA